MQMETRTKMAAAGAANCTNLMTLHRNWPVSHDPAMTRAVTKGRQITDRQRSDMASDTTKKLVVDWIRRLRWMTRHTSTLPSNDNSHSTPSVRVSATTADVRDLPSNPDTKPSVLCCGSLVLLLLLFIVLHRHVTCGLRPPAFVTEIA